MFNQLVGDGVVDTVSFKYAYPFRSLSPFPILAEAIGRSESAEYLKLRAQPVEKVKIHPDASILKLPAPSCLKSS